MKARLYWRNVLWGETYIPPQDVRINVAWFCCSCGEVFARRIVDGPLTYEHSAYKWRFDQAVCDRCDFKRDKAKYAGSFVDFGYTALQFLYEANCLLGELNELEPNTRTAEASRDRGFFAPEQAYPSTQSASHGR